MNAARALTVLAVVLGTACEAQAQEFKDVYSSTERFYFFGGWVLPPAGLGWKVQRLPGVDVDVLNFLRGEGPRHTWAASAFTVGYDSASSRDDLARIARRRTVEGQGREVSLQSFEAIPDSTLAPNAIRYRYRIEDRKVPGDKGNLYILDAQGFLFPHPAARRRLVGLEFSQRREASIPLVEDAAPDSFFANARLLRIDTEKVRRLEVGNRPSAILAGEEAVWVACEIAPNGSSNSKRCELLRVDPATMEAKARASIDGGVSDLAVGGGALWAADERNGRVLRLDPMSLAMTGSAKVGGHPLRMTVVAGVVWITDAREGRIHMIDAATLKSVRKPIRDVSAPYGIVEANGLVWFTDPGRSTVASIDPRTGAFAGTPISGFRDPVGITFGDGSLWVVCAGERGVRRLDPAARKAVETFWFDFMPGAITFAGGSAWVADYNAGRLVRVVSGSEPGPREAPCVGLDLSRIDAGVGGVWVSDAISGCVSMMPVP